MDDDEIHDEELRVRCVQAAATMWANENLNPGNEYLLASARMFYLWCIENREEE